jgi:hypothetical protein
MEEVKTKKCSKCGETKLVSEFGKNKIRKDGLQFYCKVCRSTAKPIEILPDGMKKCTKCGEIKLLDEFSSTKNKNGRTYKQSQCKKCTNECTKEWNKYNKEKILENSRKYRERNPEKAKESEMKWKQNNLEKVKEIGRKWYEKNKEKHLENIKKYNESKEKEIEEMRKKLGITPLIK